MAKNKRPPVKFVRPDAFFLTYGIINNDYNILLEKQSNCCAMCNKHMVNFKNKLLVDKVNGEVKGLLCPTCLGNIDSLRDNASKAIEYLIGDK
jgi:hypothetical protein